MLQESASWQQDAVQDIAACTTTGAVFTYLKQEAARLGMQGVSWVLKLPTTVQDGKIITFDSYSDAWRARYFEQNYLACDPTVQHGLTSMQPLLWSKTKDMAPAFWEEAAAFGLNVGFAQSLWDRHGCCSMLTLSRDSMEFSSAELTLKLPQLSWLTQLAHIGMSRLLLPADVTQAPAALSPRETEVLKLVGAGLTSQQISDRLNVTKSTIDRHMEAVRAKLHAANKTDAVVKAVRWGLL